MIATSKYTRGDSSLQVMVATMKS